MCAAQFLGAFLYAVIRGESFTLVPIFPWPVANVLFLVMFWIFGFGYLMGEGLWRKHERDYQKNEDAV
jgi:hypothetical protein